MLGKMGSGKTLFATTYAIYYRQKYPKNTIYANYKIQNIENFVYTPLGFLPFSQLHDCLIILDDIYALRNLDRYFGIIVNVSRKRNIEVVITGQYYTMFKKQFRVLADIIVMPKYDKKKDILEVYCETGKKILVVKNCVKKISMYYDTNEVVYVPTEEDIIEEIKKISKNKNDIINNLRLVFSDTSVKRILKSMGI